MKIITYLFMVYKNSNFVRHIFERLKGDNVRFFVHVDIKSKEDFSCLKAIPNVRFSSVRFSSAWGGPGFVYAIAHCLKEIVEASNTDFIVLMSETDYPIKSGVYIHHYISESNKDFATLSALLNDNPLHSPGGYWIEGGMRRVKCYAVRFGNKGIATIEPQTMNWGKIRQLGKLFLKAPHKLGEAFSCLFKPVRKCPTGLRWCGGDLWFTLRIETVRKIVEYLEKDDSVLKEAELSSCLDEVVFPTLIDTFSPKEERVDSILRYVNWPEGKSNSPTYIEMSQTELIDSLIKNKTMLFARKIQSLDMAYYIDSKIHIKLGVIIRLHSSIYRAASLYKLAG